MVIKRLLASVLFISLCFVQAVRADEGMWPLTLIQQLQNDMQARGLKLTAEDIYSINKASMKDGVVRLMTKQNRMFCTGEIISEKGMFLTNHHCGYGAIQELSTPENNILTNGFWAKNTSEEKKANFNIGLLAKVEDVTSQVLDSIGISGTDEAARTKAVSEKLKSLNASLKESLGEDKDHYVIEIIPFWAGNRYLAMYYQVFTDIRLVGTPPENIGKFGGETDNWMWPRHTADFSLFRIYADANNKPAAYSESNKPYAPKFFFPVSIKGASENDYAMIMGYPGRTQRYTYSKGIQYYADKERPKRVKVRRDILDVYEEYMHADPKIKLMYADKYASLSNYWKKFMGEASALKRLKIYDRRKAEEDKFSSWVKSSGKSQYNDVIPMYEKAYGNLDRLGLYSTYFQDAISNSQPMVFAMGMTSLEGQLSDKSKSEEAKKTASEELEKLDDRFKEYYEPIEKNVLETVLEHLVKDLDAAHLPKDLTAMASKHNNNFSAMAEEIWNKSVFTTKDKFKKFLSSPSLKTLQRDPVYMIAKGYSDEINVKLKSEYSSITSDLNRANRLFQAGMMEMSADKLFTPDANASMRLTYGRVLPYNAKDAVSYKEYTTSAGVIEKYIPGDLEFDAPPKLIDLMKKKDFGPYAKPGEDLHICFLTDNDITGGNSGSPVINGNGELIGTAFDGNWESISSDFAFEPNLQRTICVDIRYVLFVVDKFGGAGHLVNEMKLAK